MNTGPELLQSIRGVRNFFADLSGLLRASDALMGERSWEAVGDATCLFWNSASVEKGTYWIPRVAARHYVCPNHTPRTVAIVSLLIDDFEMDYELKEPVVAAAYFVLRDDIPSDQCWMDRWHACWCGYRKVPLDGSPYTVDTSDKLWKPAHRFKHMQVFGRPLVEITNQVLLQEKVIDPLLALVSSYSQSPVVAEGGSKA